MDASEIEKLTKGWNMPEGLNRSAPREVELKPAGILQYVITLILVVGGIVGAVALSRTGKRQEASARTMKAEGQETVGVVTRRWRTGGKSDEHRVSYRFTVDDRPYEGRSNVARRRWDLLPAGSPIAVRYLPANPAQNYPTADPPRPVPSWVPYLICGLVCIPAFLLPMIVRRQRQILEEGRPAAGVVTRNRRMHSNHGSHNIVYYEFLLNGGGVAKGHSNSGRTPEGTVITVLYMPDNPRRNSRYPMCLVKLATS